MMQMLKMLSDRECSWLVFLQVQASYLRINWLNTYDENGWLNSPTESTLDPPYGEIQEISTLSSWFTYERYKTWEMK